jgi:hypothetical protein
MIQEVVRYAGDRVKWLSSVSGADTLLPGDSATVNMKFRNCDMNPGTYSTNILINSNDPLNRQLAVPVVLTIDSIPAAPAAAGKNVCYGQQIPPLTATGSNIRWYSDSLLTSRVFVERYGSRNLCVLRNPDSKRV